MRGLSRLRACVVALVALCVAASLPAVAGAAAKTYTKEGKGAFEAQLKTGEVTAAGVNHSVGSVRLTLKNGRLFVYHYAAGGQQAAEAQLRSHGITPTTIKPKKKKKKSKSLGSHPRRTIAIIVVIVVVIAAAVFLLLFTRRRRRD